MPYAPAETARLALCLPELRAAEARFRAGANAAGIFYSIPADGAFRSAIFQAGLVKIRDLAVAAGEAYYRVAPPGHSFHEAGAAFDVHLENPEADGDEDPRYLVLATMASEYGLRAGYFFSAPNDIYHFELPVELATAQAEYASITQSRLATGGSVALVLAVALLAFGGMRS